MILEISKLAHERWTDLKSLISVGVAANLVSRLLILRHGHTFVALS